ncbi:response regulator transcription factor [Sphingomonas oryzagri]
MKKPHILELRISSEGAQVRFLGKMIAGDPSDEGGSYTAVVNFDARLGVLSTWLTAPTDRIRGLNSSHRRPSSGIFALSSREAEVLRHLALGESDKEIARVMAISTGTVKVHVKTIIRKLGVSNRTQAAIQALGQYAPSDGRANDLAGTNGRGDTGRSVLPHRDDENRDS